MTALDDFRRFVTDAQAGTQYAVWASANPGEVARWSSFRDAILAGQRPATPTMRTPHGRELVDAGLVYLDQSASPTPTRGAREAPRPPLQRSSTPLSLRDSANPSTLSGREIDAPGPRGNALLVMGYFDGPTEPPKPSPGPFALSDLVCLLAGAAVDPSAPDSGTDQAGLWIGAQANVSRVVAAGPWSGVETCCQCRDSTFKDVTVGWPQPDGTLLPVARTGVYVEHPTRRVVFDGLTVYAELNALTAEWAYRDPMYAATIADEYPDYPAGKAGSLDVEVRNFYLYSRLGTGAFLDAGCCGYWLHDGYIDAPIGVQHPAYLAIPTKPNRIDLATIEFSARCTQREIIHRNPIGGTLRALLPRALAPGTTRNPGGVHQRIARAA